MIDPFYFDDQYGYKHVYQNRAHSIVTDDLKKKSAIETLEYMNKNQKKEITKRDALIHLRDEEISKLKNKIVELEKVIEFNKQEKEVRSGYLTENPEFLELV
jgi:hypothetical protein